MNKPIPTGRCMDASDCFVWGLPLQKPRHLSLLFQCPRNLLLSPLGAEGSGLLCCLVILLSVPCLLIWALSGEAGVSAQVYSNSNSIPGQSWSLCAGEVLPKSRPGSIAWTCSLSYWPITGGYWVLGFLSADPKPGL